MVLNVCRASAHQGFPPHHHNQIHMLPTWPPSSTYDSPSPAITSTRSNYQDLVTHT